MFEVLLAAIMLIVIVAIIRFVPKKPTVFNNMEE